MKFVIEKIPREDTFAAKCLEIGAKHGIIKIIPSNCILTGLYENSIDAIRNMPVRDNDIFLVSNPKCGTTWCMEMTWLIGNNLDFEGAKVPLLKRFPYLDAAGIIPVEIQERRDGGAMLSKLEKMTTQRFVKSHLPKDLLPVGIWEKKAKVIFIVRNAKDAAISYFHFLQNFQNYTGTMDEFMDDFLADKIAFCPFWEHAVDFWKMRNEPNILFLTYEEMKKDLDAVIYKTAAFLGKELSEEDVASLKHHLSFDSMKKNPSVNFTDVKGKIESQSGVKLTNGSFMRQGTIGDGASALSENMLRKFDDWTCRKLDGTGLEQLYCEKKQRS